MIDRARDRRPLLLASAMALIVPFAWASLGAFPQGIGRCLAPAVGPHAGEIVCSFDNSAGLGPALTGWILYATIVLAVAFTFWTRELRAELIAIVTWTMLFGLVALATPLDVVCPALGDPNNTYCYAPWTPGWSRMAVWIVVSAAILVVGYLVRRVGPGRRLQLSR